MAQGKKALAPVVSVLNMKGGVGKTTITAHVFREFYRNQFKNVALIDFDPQFNLSQTVMDEQEYEQLKVKNQTVVSVLEKRKSLSLYETFDNDGDPPAIEELVKRMKYAKNFANKDSEETVRLDLIAGDFALSKFSLIQDAAHLARAKSRFVKFINDAREKYDVICLDCNPSSSFLTTCALTVSSHLLVPVRPDRYSMLGLRLLDNFVQGFNEIAVKPKKIIVLNGVPGSGYDPSVENELRADPTYGPLTMATDLPLSGLLQAKASYTGFATDRRVAHSQILTRRIRTLCGELAQAMGLK